MDEALKVTNRRVNALENVTIPKIANILSGINRELDELEREDFTRLKKVQALKQDKSQKGSSNGHGEANGDDGNNVLDGYDVGDDSDVVFK